MARQDQVAQAGEAGQRIAPAAQGDGQARHLRQAASHQRGDRVGAQAEPFAHAGRDGDYIFYRAANFDAHDVVVGVEAQRRPGELLLHGGGDLRLLRGDDHGRGIPARNFEREAGPGKHRQARREVRARTSAMTSLMRKGVVLEALGGAHENHARIEEGQGRCVDRASVRRGHHAEDDVRAG